MILSKEPSSDFKILAGIFVATFRRKGVENGVEKGVEKISENEQKIISLIKDNPSISKAEMVKMGKISRKAVEYNIEGLKRKGAIRRVGPTKGGYWNILWNS